MDKAGVKAAFIKAGLSRLLKDVDAITQASIRLSPTPVDESTLALGKSKVGGQPDLQADVVWPQWHDLPQSFVAQIRLDDLQAYNSDKLLPARGMLWFFYDAQQNTFGETAADAGGWQVFFREQPAALRRTPSPAKLPPASQFHACAISFASEITLAQQPQLEIPDCDWSADEQKKYEDLLAAFPSAEDHATVHHRLLGNPDTIQDDMRLQCEMIANGVTDIQDPRSKALAKSALDWRLLLQVDTDERIGMKWASSGMLYYWIKAADLQAQDFAKSWLILQSE